LTETLLQEAYIALRKQKWEMGVWYFSAIIAEDNGYRDTPVPLSANEPVPQPKLGCLLSDSPIFKLLYNQLSGLMHLLTTVLATID
jgi:hypothetical protein